VPPPAADPRQPIPPGGHGPPAARKEKRIKQFSFDPRQPIHPARIPGRPSRYYIFSAATGSRSPARLHGSAPPPAADPSGQDPRQAVALLYIQCRHRQPIPGSRSPGQDPRQAVALLYIQCAAVPGIRQLIHGSRSTAGRHGPRAHPGSNPLRGCLYRPRPRVYGSERIAVRSGPAKVL